MSDFKTLATKEFSFSDIDCLMYIMSKIKNGKYVTFGEHLSFYALSRDINKEHY